jgi:hypothetical protein
MTRWASRAVRWCAAFSALIAGFVTVTAFDRGPDLARLTTAAKQGRAFTLADLNGLTLKERKTVYVQMTPQVKAQLWQSQIAHYLSASSKIELTAAQRAALEAGRGALTPAVFAKTETLPPDLVRTVASAFTGTAQRGVVSVLGIARTQSFSGLCQATLSRRLTQPFIAYAGEQSVHVGPCFCAGNSSWDVCYVPGYPCQSATHNCSGTTYTCDPTPEGCGPWWLQPCTGMCCTYTGGTCESCG